MAPFDNSDTISNPGSTPPPAPAPTDQQNTVTPAAQFQSPASGAAAAPSPQQSQQNSPNPPQPMLSNAPAQPDDHSTHPLVHKAGVMNQVARALAGNPTRTIIDADGTRRVEPVPLSKGQIALAIAMTAVQGSLTGLAAGRGRGPGAAGAAAMTQAMQQRQQQQQRDEEIARNQFNDQANALAQKASAFAANLRSRAMAQEIGERDEAAHQAWVSQHAPTAKYIRDNAPGAIVGDMMSESQIKDPEFTKKVIANGWIAIPTGVAPRFDSDGNHYSVDGIPMHDNLYMVVDTSKLPNGRVGVAPEIVAKAAEWGLPGFANSQGQPIRHLQDLELRLGTVTDTVNKVSSLEQENKDLSDYYQFLNDKGIKGPDGKPLVAPDLKEMVRKNPALGTAIVGPWANTFGDTPSAAFKAMKDSTPGKGALLSLYGGKELLDKYELLKDLEKRGAEKNQEAVIEIGKEKGLVPVKAATAAAEAKAKAAVAATSSRNEDGTWNPASIPVALVEGNMDPSQLSKRSADYNQKIQDANAYSLQKYGKPFDLAQATTDFKQANNPQVQSMLKMVDAMSAPNGELAIAVNAAKALPQMNSSLLNKVFNITATQFGSDEATNFHTAMIGFSDLYAKVMGGGVGTDALRQSAMDVLKDGYSHGQIEGSIKILQQQIEARKAQMIGNNPYLRKQFGGSPTSVNSTQNTQGPPASLLKEGVNTTFANGQVWTLRNGQPVQVK